MGSLETDCKTRNCMFKVYSRMFLGKYAYKEARKAKAKIGKRKKLTLNVVATWRSYREI